MTIMSLKLDLSREDEAELVRQHEADLGELLPVVGPIFGFGVILFSLWDYMLDAEHALITAAIRTAFALVGTAAYMSTQPGWTVTCRAGYLYWMYASAIIVCESILGDGFRHGLAGVTACLFTVSVVALNGRTFAAMVSVPALLFATLSAMRLPLLEFVNGIMLYVFCICLAFLLMLAVRYFRIKAFLLQAELTALSRRDSLTGVFRRGYLNELAKREIALSRRSGRPLAVAMLDIDNFKRVNDTYGHDIGDKVIKCLAQTCSESLRAIDQFGRIGGEEFVCILPDTDADAAMACAERIRERIQACEVETPSGLLRFTVSIGVALHAASRDDWEDLLKSADTALYRAKREGKNRVVLAESMRNAI